MGFELSSTLGEPLAAEWKPKPDMADGDGLQLELNVDIVTLEFLDQTAEEMRKWGAALRMAEKLKSGEKEETPAAPDVSALAEQFESQVKKIEKTKDSIRVMARVLGGKPGEDDPDDRVIRSWNMTVKGKDVPVSYEFLAERPLNMLKELFDFCCFHAAAPKKTTKSKSEDI